MSVFGGVYQMIFYNRYVFPDRKSYSLLVTQIHNIYKCYASTPISVWGDGIWVKGVLVGRGKWRDWLVWQMALFIKLLGQYDIEGEIDKLSVTCVVDWLEQSEWDIWNDWENMKGQIWKVGDWDSVLQALNPAKYNFSLSIFSFSSFSINCI